MRCLGLLLLIPVSVCALVRSSSAAESPALTGVVEEIAAQDQNTLKRILRTVGVASAEVRTIERTPAQQVRVMYRLALRDMEAALRMYCDPGDEVLKAYSPNRDADANLARMEATLLEQLPRARELGCLNHIKNDQVYTVDIRVSDIPEGKWEAFIEAGQTAERSGRVERFLHPPRDAEAFHFEFTRRASRGGKPAATSRPEPEPAPEEPKPPSPKPDDPGPNPAPSPKPPQPPKPPAKPKPPPSPPEEPPPPPVPSGGPSPRPGPSSPPMPPPPPDKP